MRSNKLLLAVFLLLSMSCRNNVGKDKVDPTPTSTPQDNTVEMAIGGAFQCISGKDGVYCQGVNDIGQVGKTPGTAAGTAPFPVVGDWNKVSLPAGPYKDISVGLRHACVIAGSDKRVYCWGRDRYRNLGRGGTDPTNDTSAHPEAKPVLVTATEKLDGVTDLSAGGDQTCAIAGPSHQVYCWGEDPFVTRYTGETIDYFGSNRQYAQKIKKDTLTPENLTDALEVNVGIEHACAIAGSDNQVYCWGLNRYNANCVEVPPDPIQSSTCDLEDAIVANRSRAAAVGMLGDGTTIDSQYAVSVLIDGSSSELTGVSHLAMGRHHSCALKTNGKVVCWGSNLLDQGIANPSAYVATDCYAGLQGATPSDVVDLCVAYKARIFLDLPDTTANNLMIGLSSYKPKFIAATLETTCIADDSSWICSGSHSRGQLGNSTTPATGIPGGDRGQEYNKNPAGKIEKFWGGGESGGSAATLINFQQFCFLSDKHKVYCWGSNDPSTPGANSGSAVPTEISLPAGIVSELTGN